MDTIDPTIKRLVTAIGRVETEGQKDPYNATGASGEFGRYQYMPDTWKLWAPEFGVDVNDRSMAAQNKVAYNKIKQWKEQGLTPAQIASKWNSGDENAYKTGHKGINAQGVAYDTPAYALKVSDYYKNLGGEQATKENVSPETPVITESKILPSMQPEAKKHIEKMYLENKPQSEIDKYINDVNAGTAEPEFNYLKEVGKEFISGGQKIVDSTEAGRKMLEEASQEKNPLMGALKGGVGLFRIGAGGFVGAAETVFSPVTPIVKEFAKDIINAPLFDEVRNDPLTKNFVNNISKPLDKVVQSNPEEAQAIMDGINTLLIVAGSRVAPDIKATEIKLPKIKNPFGKLTSEEIALVPQKDVYKLSPREQEIWYRKKSEIVQDTATKLSNEAKEISKQNTEQVKKDIDQFNQFIGTSSRETAISLKEPAKQLMKDASEQYIKLTGEAVEGNPSLSKTLNREDLGFKIDSRFEKDANIAESLKKDLGITEIEQEISSEGLPIIEAKPKVSEITNQEILDKAREIMQKVSKTSRTGGKVYSPSEYEAIQKYSFLMETLGENGIDMKLANDFWKKWVPVRNKIVNQIKPFDEEVIGGTPFAKTIQKAEGAAKTAQQVASKLDAQNFITELETRMKLPEGTIGADIRESIQGLEKAKLSKENIDKIEKETIQKIKDDKTITLRSLKDLKDNTLYQAKIRSIIKKSILIVLGLGALETPIGKAVIHGAI